MAHESHFRRAPMKPPLETPLRSRATSSIAIAIGADPICLRIVRFLLENESAMDTAKGIAAWWVRCDEIAAQVALDRLIACGAVIAHTLTSGPLYGLTRDEEVRDWLRATYGRTAGRRPRSLKGDKVLLSH